MKIPILFDNIHGFDAFPIATHLANIYDHPLKLMGQGMEKYLRLSVGEYLTLSHSLQVLVVSFEEIVKNLRAPGLDKFKLLQSVFRNATTDQLDLLLLKPVYP